MRPRNVVADCGRTPLHMGARTPWPRCAYSVRGLGRSALSPWQGLPLAAHVRRAGLLTRPRGRQACIVRALQAAAVAGDGRAVPEDWSMRRSAHAPRRSSLFLTTVRFAVERMSEAPVLAPLALLGDFVAELGRPPERERVTTYLARLRERVCPRNPCIYPCLYSSIILIIVRLCFFFFSIYQNKKLKNDKLHHVRKC